MKSIFSIFLFVFIAQSVLALSYDIPAGSTTLSLPYQVNFSQAELDFLKNIDATTLQKLIAVIKIITENYQKVASLNSNISTTYSNTSGPNTPYYNSQTGQYQSKQVGQENSSGGSYGGSQISNPYLGNSSGSSGGGQSTNPYLGNSSPLGGGQQQPTSQIGQILQGVNQGLNPNQLANIKPDDFKNLFPDGGKGGKCDNYGVVNNMGGRSFGGPGALSTKLRFDLSRLCQLTGKKIIITSGRRGNEPESSACGSESQHNCGKAIDTSLDPYSDSEKTVVTLYFMAHSYGGIGSYGSGPMHFDHRNGSMRWGPPGPPFKRENCKAGAYYPAVQKAFALVGAQPCDLVDINTIRQKAISVLQQMGKGDFAIGLQ